ncbi:hypothetical protein LTS14_009260 [Recurvomyces mirabilis]|uniref:uncharacterized protein n=1 Tax=Recurvomyces mirabilis TaxID=574656 RepID=UPI002DE07C04|nr:hypothetical protein LTS14_009260 [Recurvomyces mirabilis]
MCRVSDKPSPHLTTMTNPQVSATTTSTISASTSLDRQNTQISTCGSPLLHHEELPRSTTSVPTPPASVPPRSARKLKNTRDILHWCYNCAYSGDKKGFDKHFWSQEEPDYVRSCDHEACKELDSFARTDKYHKHLREQHGGWTASGNITSECIHLPTKYYRACGICDKLSGENAQAFYDHFVEHLQHGAVKTQWDPRLQLRNLLRQGALGSVWHEVSAQLGSSRENFVSWCLCHPPDLIRTLQGHPRRDLWQSHTNTVTQSIRQLYVEYQHQYALSNPQLLAQQYQPWMPPQQVLFRWGQDHASTAADTYGSDVLQPLYRGITRSDNGPYVPNGAVDCETGFQALPREFPNDVGEASTDLRVTVSSRDWLEEQESVMGFDGSSVSLFHELGTANIISRIEVSSGPTTDGYAVNLPSVPRGVWLPDVGSGYAEGIMVRGLPASMQTLAIPHQYRNDDEDRNLSSWNTLSWPSSSLTSCSRHMLKEPLNLPIDLESVNEQSSNDLARQAWQEVMQLGVEGDSMDAGDFLASAGGQLDSLDHVDRPLIQEGYFAIDDCHRATPLYGQPMDLDHDQMSMRLQPAMVDDDDIDSYQAERATWGPGIECSMDFDFGQERSAHDTSQVRGREI